MSFQADVKKEIAEHISQDRGAQLSGLGAILICIGTFSENADGHISLTVSTGDELVLTKCFTLLQKTSNITTESRRRAETASDFADLTGILTQKQIRSLAAVCGYLDEAGEGSGHLLTKRRPVAESLLSSDRSERSFLRNLFLCIGTLSDPAKEYQLSFLCSDTVLSATIMRLFTRRKIPVKLSVRKKSRAVYTRDAEVISDILSLIGAHGSLLWFENFRVVKQVRGGINRKVNCETANIQKTVSAAARQVGEIEFLKQSGAFERLPDNLREVAKIRLEYPELSLTELGGLMNPPVGKSGVNHRLRRLSDAAREERAKRESKQGKGGVPGGGV